MLALSPQKDEPDAFKELGTGNRIATWLFYVSKKQIFEVAEGILLRFNVKMLSVGFNKLQGNELSHPT